MDKFKKNITIPIHCDELKLSLRMANDGDLPNLRLWKNEQREYFFFKGEISPEQQREWFRVYRQRPDDFMFMVLVENTPIGCMGIRFLDHGWDIYNVILGSSGYGGKGLMGKAFQAMLHFAISRRANPITLKVLKHNPAVDWYRKNGFCVTSEQSDHFCMVYQLDKS